MDSLWKKAAEFLYNRRKDKRWRKIVTCLAAVVVFVTTYALILPAITMDDETAEQEPGVVLVQDEAATEAATVDAESAEADVSEEAIAIESEGSDEEEAIVIDSDNGADDADVADPDAEEADIQLIDVTADESTEPITKTYQDDEIEITATYGTEANIPEEAEFRVTKLAVEETDEADEAVSEESEEIEAADTAEVTERYRYDIGFYVGEEEIEPEAAVSLSVRFLAGQFAEAEEITAVHYLDDNDPSNTETIKLDVNEDQNGNVQAEFDMDSFSVVEFQGSNVVSEDAQAESEENTTELQTSDSPTVFANREAGTFTLTYQGQVITVHCVDEDGTAIPTSNVTDYSASQKDQTYTFAKIRPDIEGYKYQSAHWENYNGTKITSVTTTTVEVPLLGVTIHGWKTSASNRTRSSGDVYLVYQEDNAKITVTFDANGGSGNAPEALTVPAGEQITFPDQNNLTNGNKKFIGWSTNSKANTDNGAYLSPVYAPMNKYEVTSNITFYAIWADTDYDAVYYIRLDGRIPTEPSQYTASKYTSGIRVKEALVEAKFTSNTTGVDYNLKNKPSNQLLLAVLGENYKLDKNGAIRRVSDDAAMYVLWYVTKKDAPGPIYNYTPNNWNSDGDNWHIDGVILEVEKINLTYDPNAPAGVWTEVPLGTQWEPESKVLAGTNNTNNIDNLHNSNSAPGTSNFEENIVTPARNDGYVFAGWKKYIKDHDTNDWVETSEIYQPGDEFIIQEDTLLVAQWVKDKANLTVKKTDMDRNPIDTATFQLENTEDSGSDAKSVSTTQGVADFSSIELNTVYALNETVAPTGYERRTDTIYFKETKNGSTYGVEYYSNPEGTTSISKPDWVSASFTGSNLTLTIRDEQIRRNVQFIKKDSAGNTLEGAVFKLKDSDDETVDILQTSGSDGVFSQNNATLPYGTYTLTETTAPNGYATIDPITFTVGDNGITVVEDNSATVDVTDDELYTITVKDTYAPKIKIQKVASGGGTDENPEYLSGAEFDLFASKQEGNETVIDESRKLNEDAYVSNENGTFSLGKLPEGVYFLKETKAPDGYKLLTDPIRITVTNNKVTVNGASGANPSSIEKNNDGTYTITVSNSTGQELPHTGGSGTTLFTFGGLAILAGCLMAGYSMRRKRERRSE